MTTIDSTDNDTIDACESTAPTDGSDTRHSRRLALRLAGAGLVGAVAASAIAEAAAADDGVTLAIGTPTTTTSPVRTVYQGAAGNVGYLFESGASGGSNASTFPAVVGAWARPTGTPVHGIYAFTAKPNGSAVVAESTDASGIGLDATGGSRGVRAKGPTAVEAFATGTANGNRAVRAVATGESSTGVSASADGGGSVGLAANATGDGITVGVSGVGRIGGSFSSNVVEDGYGIAAFGSWYGASLRGGRAALLLRPQGTPPPTQTVAHERGEMVVDSTGDVWVCVAPGTPGTWRKLAGAATTGALHAIEPARVYDSRRNMAPTASGPLAAGQNRLIPVRDRRDVDTGVVNGVDVVPAGATAIAYNVTVTATIGTGFLYVAPGTATSIAASTINWHASTQGAVANAAIVATDATRRIRVFANGSPGAQAHVIIDVTGYYR